MCITYCGFEWVKPNRATQPTRLGGGRIDERVVVLFVGSAYAAAAKEWGAALSWAPELCSRQRRIGGDFRIASEIYGDLFRD